MGLSALTMRGWRENPRREGRSHLIIAIIVIASMFLYNIIWGEWSSATKCFCVVIAIWGVFGFMIGELLNWIKEKTK